MVHQEVFGKHNGKDVYPFIVTIPLRNVIRLTTFGAKLIWIEVPDKNGVKDNIALGYDTFEETLNGDMSFGSVVSQYINRWTDKINTDSMEWLKQYPKLPVPLADIEAFLYGQRTW